MQTRETGLKRRREDESDAEEEVDARIIKVKSLEIDRDFTRTADEHSHLGDAQLLTPLSAACRSPAPVSVRDTRDNGAEMESISLNSATTCFGSLIQLSCQLLPAAYELGQDTFERAALDSKHVRLAVQLRPERCKISLLGSLPIANLNLHAAAAFIDLDRQYSSRFTAYTTLAELCKATQAPTSTKKQPRVVSISANVYGNTEDSNEVGKLLSARQLFLQQPEWRETGIEYSNPHFLTFNDLSDADIWLEEMTLNAADNGVSNNEVDWSLALDDLPQYTESSVNPYPALLPTPLMDHQLAGLGFMLKRESGTMDEKMRYWCLIDDGAGDTKYRHVVTGDERTSPQDEPRGGILGDDMGLGKTFTTLAVILSSLPYALSFETGQRKQYSRHSHVPVKSRATLVVLPSLLILKGWIGEIERKLRPGSLRFAIYHGQERAACYSQLQDRDIVFTTYGTITREYKRKWSRHVLFSLSWFRIVLDEAHVIRSQNTKQFEAIMKIHGRHHWCLTGTPISNKVEDLGALLQFCRVPLLQDRFFFREHLTKATKRSFRAGHVAVQRALAPVCLRRTRKLLDLPEPARFDHTIELSPEELEHYQKVNDLGRRVLDAVVSGNSIDKDEDLDQDEAMALLQQKEEDRCCLCGSEAFLINQWQDHESGMAKSCTQVLCEPCQEAQETTAVESSICQRGPHAAIAGMRQDTKINSSVALRSSKLEKLLTELEQSQNQEKSLVLSCWRKTIDLARELCQRRAIKHAFVHGGVPQKDRVTALDQFVNDPATSVLFMTMGTGALGLNLTAATRIHILEPQWNPYIEEQAIGRSIRIGQERTTTVIRYVVKGSIEEQVQIYQRRKKQLLAGGFGETEGSSTIEVQTRLLTATFFRASSSSSSLNTI